MEMKITLILFGHLRHYRGQKEESVEIPGGETLMQILERLKIPADDVMTFFIEGKQHDGSHIPSDGETIEVIPAISGG